MSDSTGNKESIIVQHRLKNLYSYSKQSLAPAVSTVGFFFLKRKILLCKTNETVALPAKVKQFNSGSHNVLLSYSTLMCITYTLMNNILFLIFGQNTLMISTQIGNGKKS